MTNPNTTIEWTDRTWSPTTGCDRVSAGCDNCYALALAARLKAMGKAAYQRDGNPKTSGPGFGVSIHPDRLADPLHWRKPSLVFVDSMSDLWHAEVPYAFIDQVFTTMASAPQHTFQILTKRPQRMQRYIEGLTLQHQEANDEGRISRLLRLLVRHDGTLADWPLPNVWLGVSVENQDVAWRIDWLVKTPAAVRFLSCEPLLGSLDLSEWLWSEYVTNDRGSTDWEPTDALHWVITGGESGPHARPCDPNWVRSIRDQCVDAGVAYFHKQWGGRIPKARGRMLDGVTWDEFPMAVGA